MFTGLLRVWASIVSTTAGRFAAGVTAVRASIDALRARDLHALHGWPVVTASVALLVAGAAIRVALSEPGPELVAAAVASLSALGWAAARLGMLVAVLGTSRARSRAAVGAWAAGTWVWVVSVNPVLAFVAWAASAALSWVVLRRDETLPAPRARRAVLVAWGVQAAVSILSWLAVNGWFASLIR